MASGPITAWQIEGEEVEVVTTFLFLGSKITADGKYSHEIRTRLLLGRKAKINLNRVLKNRDYSANKGPYRQCCGLPSGHIWLWELDRKKGRMPKNWCLQIVVLENIPGSPLDSKEIKPVNLKRDLLNIHWCWSWNSSILMWTNGSLEKPLMLGKVKGRRRRHQRMRWLDGITVKLQEMVRDREVWRAAVHGVPKSWTQLDNWTTTSYSFSNCF